MLKNFRSYQLAVDFYKSCEKVHCAKHLRYQLDRAASSVSLNLAEGSERGTAPDKARFYRMAMGSVSECQAILDLAEKTTASENAKKKADELAANVFNLIKATSKKVSKPNRDGAQGTPNSAH